MSISVEGIGGTGKAVISILNLQLAIADAAGIFAKGVPRPKLDFRVADADVNAVWPGVPIERLDPGTGIFRDLIGATDSISHASALALYADGERELDSNVQNGFYGKPKLAASLLPSTLQANINQSDIHVLVFSDIGGTGAGVGPLKLQAALADTGKSIIVAIVFGKYLNHGAPRPVGLEWLDRHANFDGTNNRLFNAYYLTLPPVQGSEGTMSSGLNVTPGLVIASNFVWRVAEREAKGAGIVRDYLKSSDRPKGSARIRRVPFGFGEGFELGGDDFVGQLRSGAEKGLLNPVILEPYRYRGVKDAISSSDLSVAAWKVLESAVPPGEIVEPTIDYDGGFRESFTSVPDQWAAADWFHKGVLAGRPMLATMFRKLALGHVAGRLYPTRLSWAGFKGEVTYALSLKPLAPESHDYAQEFRSNVVGFMSSSRPFWTTADMVDNLFRLDVGSEAAVLRMAINAGTAFGAEMPASGMRLDRTDAVACEIELSHVVRQELSSWSWSITRPVEDWRGLTRAIGEWPLLSASLRVMSGGIAVGTGAHAYACHLRGVRLERRPFGELDRLVVGKNDGVEYFAVEQMTEGATQLRRFIAHADEETPRNVEPTQTLGIVVSNIEMLLKTEVQQ